MMNEQLRKKQQRLLERLDFWAEEYEVRRAARDIHPTEQNEERFVEARRCLADVETALDELENEQCEAERDE